MTGVQTCALPISISDPGKYTYSNLGFSLLALALQAAAPPTASRPHGRENSFGLCYEQILGPLGMVQTQPCSERMKATLPRGFDPNGNVASPGWGPFPAYYGAGGLVSTPNDMMTWLQFNMGIIQAGGLNDILPVTEASAAPGLSGSTVPGLGWFITTLQEGGSGSAELTFIQKNGGLSGASSQMAFLPRNGCPASNAGVFVLTNLGNTPPSTSTATKIAYDLLFVMAGLQPPY